MPYDPDIDVRIQRIVSSWQNIAKKKMFGGVCFLQGGRMFCGVYKSFLILRLGVPEAEKALALAHVHPFDITGRAMKGWVMVSAEGFSTEDRLEAWIERARAFVTALPEK